ncbi:glycosyltransferase family protein [Brevibacterium litoralis]|uniref:glycosyltransferase family protein n=1 Tax=Brevibacterium litoralis TaxID=3138935 RepID=UPI0032EB92BF
MAPEFRIPTEAVKKVAGDARTALWHLRQGGPTQLKEWLRRQRAGVGGLRFGHSDDPAERFPALTGDDRAPVFGTLRVGTILDEFSASSFRYEWDCVGLERKRASGADLVGPDAFRPQVEGLDMVFVESAWNGNDGAWQYQLTGTNGVKQPFKDLMAACREAGVPTVFWNKEDPPHFEDFLEAAALFDVVFTSDERLVPEYRDRLGHDRVGVLGFAAQPAIHNPARPDHGFQEYGIAFAGMYFAHKYPERREQMDWLLGAALDAEEKSGEDFAIFSRQLGGDERYQFPGELGEHVVGSLPYPHMLSAYKGYKAFLNVNSVVDSPSMCARRIFEITASGTPVVTAPSAATRAFFPADEVFQPSDRAEATDVLRALVSSPELRDRAVHLAQRRIWDAHTYTHRAMTVMDAAGVEYEVPFVGAGGSDRAGGATGAGGARGEGASAAGSAGSAGGVSVLVSTNRPEQLDHVFRSVGRQCLPDVQLSLVTHGFSLSSGAVADLAGKHGVQNYVHRTVGADRSLGECLNAAIEAADGAVMSKMDDDDLYGEHYLSDLVAALRYSGADLVGKQAHYVHLESNGATVLRFGWREHRYTDLVMGPTLTAPAAVFRDLGFADRTQGEDTDLQRRLVDGGGRIYAADRFNFVQMRSARAGHHHTWDVADTHVMAGATVHAYGPLSVDGGITGRGTSSHYFF